MLPNKSRLTKLSQLETLVDIDKADHKLKDIAQLFVNASRDWDTFNQIDISDFVKELNECFGSPLNKEKIADTPVDTSCNNAWRHEAGSSIIEMLDLSVKSYNQNNFDKILSDILSYYEQQMQGVDFIADLKYLTTEEGDERHLHFLAIDHK